MNSSDFRGKTVDPVLFETVGMCGFSANAQSTTTFLPGSTFIDEFSNVIAQNIADFKNYCIIFQNPSITVESGRKGKAFD